MFDTNAITPEVTSNRSGVIAETQRKRVAKHLLSLGVASLILLGAAAALAAGAAAYLMSFDWRVFDVSVLIPALSLALLAAGFGLGGLWPAYRFLLAWQDFSEGRVEQSEGRIAWGGSSYRAEASGHRLDLAGLPLAPGAYRFFLLPRSGRVLSAESLAGGMMGSGQDELSNALAQANRFDVASLPELRQGRLPQDNGRLLTRIWAGAAALALTTVIFGGLFLWMLILDSNSAGNVMVWIAAAVLVGVALGILWNAVNVTRDVMEGRVAMETGSVRREVRHSNRSTSYYYLIGKRRFTVSAAAYNALIEGRSYRVYYLPRSKKMVGIEPLDESTPRGWA